MQAVSTSMPSAHVTPFESVTACTTDFLEYHALQTPDKIAFHAKDVICSYSKLYLDLQRVTLGLNQLGLRSGQFALVHESHPYRHLLLLLACENLRVGTASIQSLSPTILYTKADVVLSETHSPGIPVLLHTLDSAWFEAVASTSAALLATAPRERGLASDLMRVSRSSGTTGIPKVVRINRGQFEQWVSSQIRNKAYTPKSIFLTDYGFEVYSVWGQIAACFRMGATVVLGALLDRLTRYDVSHLWLLPNKISELLRQLPADWEKPRNLVLFTGGAPVSDPVSRHANRVLCTDLVNNYAANEVGSVCRLDRDNTGYLFAGVDLRIVDAAGAELPIGEEGEIAVRAPWMIHDYWQQPDYTATHFRQGWFYPGDRGRLIGYRHLQLMGRSDDMLNIGGIKQPADMIERTLSAMPSVLEVAAAKGVSTEGVDVLLIAVVLSDNSLLPAVRKAAASKIPLLARYMFVFARASLPRTPNGKVMRSAIAALAQSS